MSQKKPYGLGRFLLDLFRYAEWNNDLLLQHFCLWFIDDGNFIRANLSVCRHLQFDSGLALYAFAPAPQPAAE